MMLKIFNIHISILSMRTFLTIITIIYSQLILALEGHIEVNGHRFEVIQKIGSGGEGDVFEVQEIDQLKRRYALKVEKIMVINPNGSINPLQQEEFTLREYKFDYFKNRVRNFPDKIKSTFKYLPFTFSYLIHLPEEKFRDPSDPNLLIKSGVSFMRLADDTLYSQIEKINQTLFSTIEEQHKAKSDLALLVFNNIIKELSILSEKNYSYLDLKPVNIGFDSISNTYSLLDLNSIYSTFQNEDYHRKILATPVYAAPEISDSNKYSEISQLYSLAMTLLNVLDSKFENHIIYKMFNKNDNSYDQNFLIRLEKEYLQSFANIDRSKISQLFSFIKAATIKDPYTRLKKLRELSFNQDIVFIADKANIKQSKTSALIESLKSKLTKTRPELNSKIICDGLFK